MPGNILSWGPPSPFPGGSECDPLGCEAQHLGQLQVPCAGPGVQVSGPGNWDPEAAVGKGASSGPGKLQGSQYCKSHGSSRSGTCSWCRVGDPCGSWCRSWHPPAVGAPEPGGLRGGSRSLQPHAILPSPTLSPRCPLAAFPARLRSFPSLTWELLAGRSRSSG